jgi:hypothetical protein
LRQSLKRPFSKPTNVSWSPGGGVLTADGWVLTRLGRQLADLAPGFKLVVPTVPPVIGAYYLALKDSGIHIDDGLLKRVTDQVRSRVSLTSKMAFASPE